MPFGQPDFPFARLGVYEALEMLTASAVQNIPGAEFASVSVRHADQRLQTVAATDELADRMDEMQYELREGPCYSAVTDEQFVFPNYGPRAVDLGVRAQLATQVAHNGSQAGL